ncbi:hypothetical protein BDW42DRAFT_74620 [Aspergillus taichungensis]|uniref:Uncharacterized protein n=1 Tax=Aspergillus taichungensis TaxID=482145 RepID=A0A2J5HZ97_9EURO|nr:hypothetical protein BDW42DRAFT_74620 [Aspergillus taichungensis]
MIHHLTPITPHTSHLTSSTPHHNFIQNITSHQTVEILSTLDLNFHRKVSSSPSLIQEWLSPRRSKGLDPGDSPAKILSSVYRAIATTPSTPDYLSGSESRSCRCPSAVRQLSSRAGTRKTRSDPAMGLKIGRHSHNCSNRYVYQAGRR